MVRTFFQLLKLFFIQSAEKTHFGEFVTILDISTIATNFYYPFLRKESDSIPHNHITSPLDSLPTIK